VRREREFDKAMRAASSNEEGDKGEPAPARPEKHVPVNV
jgi:hypothetical protein